MRPLFSLLILLLTGFLMAQSSADFARVDSLLGQGKTRSALTLADEIYGSADRADILARALDYRAALTGQLAEDDEQATVALLRTAVTEHSDRPVFTTVAELLLGEYYFRYAERNSYRLSELSVAGEGPVSDSLPLADYGMDQLLFLSHRHLYRALELARENQTPLANVPVLIAGNDSRTEEVPTLYDLMIERAMNVLGSPLGSVGDEGIANDSLALLPAEAFAAQDLGLNFDLTKGTPRKLQLYQQWIAYHLEAGGPALLYADLERMKFVHRSGVADSTYLSALQRMYDTYPGVAARDRILVEMAGVLDRNDEQLGERPRVRAFQLLDRIGKDDPVAAALAAELRASITQPALETQVESFYPRRTHLLVQLGYRNVMRVYYRLYAYDPATAPADSYRAEERLAAIEKGKLVASGSQRLAPNDDYSRHTTELDLDPLSAGGYQLVVSTDQSFRAQDAVFSVTPFQVTDLAVVHFEGPEGKFVQVSDRTTGAPVSGVNVQLRQGDRRGQYTDAGTRTTNAEGTFALPATKDYRNYQLILTSKGGDRLVTDLYSYDRNSAPGLETRYTTLLTDRPLYRPGQTLHVYGLRYRTDGEDLPSILANDKVTVILRDANYQEVASREVTSDTYGRFSLDFTLPEGGLTGGFTVQTDNGSASFRVEAYKRPRFEVELEAPAAVVSGATATVRGTALTYAGPPVADAGVSYRVYLEEVRWFFARYTGEGGGGGSRELLSSGTATTDESGAFSFDFTTRERLDTRGYRRYRYVVEADVTDATGESHEATTTVGVRGQRPAIAITPQRESVDRGDSLTLLVASDNADTSLEIEVRIVPVTKPNAALLERRWDIPDRPVINRAAFERNFPDLAYGAVPELAEWPSTGGAVYEATLTVAGGERRIALAADYPVGHYRVEFAYPDGTAGEPATFSVYSTVTAELPAGELYRLDGAPDTITAGEPLELTLLSAVDLPLIRYRWQSRSGATDGKVSGGRKLTFTYTPTEADRGGLSFSLAGIRLNRLLTESRQLAFPWSNKELRVEYTTFRDRLRPGVPEEWTVVIRNSDGSPVEAAALATMYDASLDQLYAGQGWEFSPYPLFYGGGSLVIGNSFGSNSGNTFDLTTRPSTDTVPALPRLLLLDDRGRTDGRLYKSMPVSMRAASRVQGMAVEEEVAAEFSDSSAGNVPPPPPAPASPAGEEPVQLRTNLQETAFWLPNLTAAADGSLHISFTSPEALTAWKFRLFAHDKGLRYVISEQEIVTQKELMVLPNVPRFVREGDELTLTARVSNTSEAGLATVVRLELFDPATDSLLSVADFGGAAGAGEDSRELGLAAGGSETVRFTLSIPEGLSDRGLLGYRITARGGAFSDGEENVIPVLTDRTLITVTTPFYLKQGDRKTVTLPLLANYQSETLRQVGYVFEATTNPAWLALKSLPYLMEYPYDCTEQLANRYFANQLAYATVSQRPVLEEVFRKWEADSTALLSELQRNESLTNALLTETPWVQEAQSESEQRARIAELFQLKRLAAEQAAALVKLSARQQSDGSYSWFPDGQPDRYMTQYVLETLARMRQLGVIADEQRTTVGQIERRAVDFLDGRLADDYRRLFANVRDSVDLRKRYQPTALQVHYLYARAMADAPATGEAAGPLNYFRDRAFASWTDYGLYEQALIAIAAHAEQNPVATTILESLRERALHSDEMGIYWKYEAGYRWNNLPIETHTRLLEAFRLVDPRPEELDEMRLWLLSNKRTNRWETTKATAAAVYALLNTGDQYTVEQSAKPLEASWPGAFGKVLGNRVTALQGDAEAGTGEFTVRIAGEDVTRDLASVKLRNRGNDLVWGGVFWQYTEVASEVKESNNGPLTLERQLFKRTGDQLSPLADGEVLTPGDRITVRLTVRSDREMDYVHVKDRRAATFEPVESLSGYRYDGGLGYYFAPGDLATNFFIDHLPKGTYTLEYDLFTTYAGFFSNGLGRVECLYAPEFGGNSGGGRVLVR